MQCKQWKSAIVKNSLNLIHLRSFKSLPPHIVKPTHLRCFLHEKKIPLIRQHMSSTWCNTWLDANRQDICQELFLLMKAQALAKMSREILEMINKKSEHWVTDQKRDFTLQMGWMPCQACASFLFRKKKC